MISWNQWLRLFSQPIFNVFNHKKLYTNKKKRPFLEGLEERITPVNPSVISILRNAGTTASTSASYAVSFSESVTGVDSADFTTSTSGGVASTSISVTGSGATYTVTISGITGTGSISLNLVDNDTIRNSTSQPLGGTNLPGISFSAKTDYSTGGSVNFPSGPHAITTGLINADGFTDIITANRFNSKISVLLGVGDGTFNTQTTFATGTEPQGIAAADINGDSKLDLVTANSLYDPNISGTTGNTVSIFLGNGNSTFIAKPKIATQTFPLSVILGDFNADSKLDIVTANFTSNSVSILLGNGDGTFIAATNFATGSGPKSVAMGDVNGDGFLDLATANFTAPNSLERLSLLLGNGDGSFKAPTALTAGSNPFSVIMADVNGDGKKDLISANYGSNNVSILLGNGDGTFQSATSASTGTRPVSVAAADLDGDGKIDLAVANSYNNIVSPINSISLLAGNGDGTFKTAVNFTTGTRPYCVTIADINGDSKPDIATANEGSDNISVFLNTTNNPANFVGQTYTVAPPATQTSITTSAAGAPSGLAFTTQPVITIKDAAGNTVITSTAAVTMTVSTGATTVGTATVNAVNGIATFTNVGISGTSGTSYTLTFTSGSLATATQTITPTFGLATRATLSTSAAGSASGSAFTTQPIITIKDTFGNIVTTSTPSGTVTVGRSGTTVGTATVNAIAGIATFSDVGISGTSGTSYTLTFTSGSLATATQTITPTFGLATRATLTTSANGSASGSAFTTQPIITIKDTFGNIVTTSTASVTMTVSGNGTTVGTATVNAIAGIATFSDVGISGTAGTSYTLTFTSGSLATAAQTITPTFGLATRATLTTSANGSASGSAFTNQPIITIKDTFGNIVTTSTASVTMTVSGNGTTVGTVTAVAVAGVATFSDIGISGTAGTSYTLTFASGSLATATQTITPTFGLATRATLSTAANGSASGSAFTTQPIITIKDTFGNIVTTSTASVIMTVSGNGTTVGTTTVNAVAGVATFSDVGISGTAGTSYTLTFVSSGLTSITQTITPTDTTAPTITIGSDKTSLKIGETATITFTLSEISANFTASDITTVGGTLSTLTQGSGNTYTATFTPTNNSTTPATFNVLANTFTDAAGNANTAATQLSVAVDTAAPTITITSSTSTLKIGETATITFTLSEASSDFTATDIVTVGGTLGALSNSGLIYTATFTPTNNSTTPATFNVLANTFTDGVGNPNTAATQLSINIDTIAPTITITSSASSLKSGETANLTFTLSKISANFSASDITTVGGTLSALSNSGLIYTATFTPTNNSTTPATFNVLANTFTDAAGNPNSAATQLSVTVDTIAPTITISSNKTTLKIGETATLTFTLSEASSNFVLGNITSAGGTLGTLSNSGLTYTATFTPTNNSTTPATFNVLANTFIDAAGNNNTAATQFSIQVDTVAPTITITSSASALKSGETATLTFTLSEASSNFILGNITSVGGTLGTLSNSGLTYTATFTPTNNSTTPATFNVLANTFTDTAGNNNIAATQLSITVDTVAPTITITSSASALKSGETATITFTLSEAASTALISSNITVAGGALSNFTGSGTSYTATFTPTNNSTTPATFNVLANTFTDGAGNPSIASNTISMTVDTTTPTPSPAPSPTPSPTPSPAPIPSPAPAPSPTPTPPRMMTASSSSFITSESSTVNLIDQDTGKQINSVTPFPGFSGELRIAMGDMNHDGKMETIVAAGPGGGPAIIVMDSETGTVLQTFFAFDPAFKGGIFVAIADFNSDGIMDIVVGAGSGGGPHVNIFDGLTLNVLRSFFAYQENFSGGVSVAAIDINGNGFAELVTGAGIGGNSHVKVFDGKTFEIISQWYAYPPDFKGGIFVAVGDIGNDGTFEVATGAGEGGGPVVAIWDPYTGALLNQFLAYDENFRGGARVGISDGNGDGIADLLTGAGPGGGPQVNGYSFPALDLLFSFYSGNPNNAGGVFVS